MRLILTYLVNIPWFGCQGPIYNFLAVSIIIIFGNKDIVLLLPSNPLSHSKYTLKNCNKYRLFIFVVWSRREGRERTDLLTQIFNRLFNIPIYVVHKSQTILEIWVNIKCLYFTSVLCLWKIQRKKKKNPFNNKI